VTRTTSETKVCIERGGKSL